jgi:outer membrane receptor protein involved in Fe transport
VAQGIPQAAISSYTFPTTATGQLVSGNTALTPERANTFNVGFVLNSPFDGGLFSDFTLSVDYYNISVENVISNVPGLTVLSKCFNLDGSNPTYDRNNQFCGLLQRDNAGQLVTVATPFLNLGSVKTDGVEAQVNWSVPSPFLRGDSGRLFVNAAVGWLNKYNLQLLPGAPVLDYTGISNGAAGVSSLPPRATPKWKSVTSFGYRSDNASLGMRWRYQSGMKDTTSVLTPATAQVGVGAYALWDMFGTIKVNKTIEFRAGVNNMFDRGLPFVASSQNGTDVALYDPIGRSFYMGARVNF